MDQVWVFCFLVLEFHPNRYTLCLSEDYADVKPLKFQVSVLHRRREL